MTELEVLNTVTGGKFVAANGMPVKKYVKRPSGCKKNAFKNKNGISPRLRCSQLSLLFTETTKQIHCSSC